MGSDEEGLLVGTNNVIYGATSQAYQEYQNALGKHEKRRKEDLPGGCKSTLYLFPPSGIIFDISTSQSFEPQAILALYSGGTRLLSGFQNLGYVLSANKNPVSLLKRPFVP